MYQSILFVYACLQDPALQMKLDRPVLNKKCVEELVIKLVQTSLHI